MKQKSQIVVFPKTSLFFILSVWKLRLIDHMTFQARKYWNDMQSNFSTFQDSKYLG